MNRKTKKLIKEKVAHCGICMFYKKDSEYHGHCKRYPPPSHTGSLRVEEFDWCGEFERK